MNKTPLLSFELTKLYKNKFTYIIPSIILIALIILYYFTYSNFNLYKDQTAASLSMQIESFETSIKELENIPEAQQLKEKLSVQKELTQQKLKAFDNSNWEKYTELQIKIDKNLISLIESGNAHIPLPVSEVKKQVALNEEVLEREVLLVEPGAEVEGIHFTILILKMFFNFIGTFMFILIVCKLFAQEIEIGTFKFLTNQPIHIKKLIYSKYLICISVSFLLTLLVLVLAFLIGFISNGTGDFNYPVLITTGLDTYQFISNIEFIIKSIVLYLFGIMFISSLVYLISVLIKNALISFILASICILSGTILFQNIEPLLRFAHLNPFLYLNSASVISMDIADKLNNYNFSFYKGIILFSIASIIINITSIKIVKRFNLN